MKVADRMTTNIVTLNATATATEAAKKMQSEKVGTVLVLEGGSLKGLVTDRQIVTKVVAAGKDPARVTVNEFMTKDPVTISPGKDIHEAGRIMGDQGYRRIPVVDGGKLLGIISIADIAEHAMSCKTCVQDILREIKKGER
ncbi:MAG: CBS domain-containing protein [Methanotrichaceae archaeon]|nr:CBS domain-containing protein [Methanotrichaceae archaeon]